MYAHGCCYNPISQKHMGHMGLTGGSKEAKKTHKDTTLFPTGQCQICFSDNPRNIPTSICEILYTYISPFDAQQGRIWASGLIAFGLPFPKTRLEVRKLQVVIAMRFEGSYRPRLLIEKVGPREYACGLGWWNSSNAQPIQVWEFK